MATTQLYSHGSHRNLLLEDFSGAGLAIQANQHVIVDGAEGIILDPGGHKVYAKVLGATLGELGRAKLKHIFLSHQDPDIVAAINGWLMTTDATALASQLWTRFIPHFGLDSLVQDRLKPIPDRGMRLALGSCELLILPAHFLHSCGNFHIYDPVSRILYTGDLAASTDGERAEVTELDAHIPRMKAFHQRYMQSNRALRAWTRMVRPLEVEMIAPQHGALLRGSRVVHEFYDWCDQLACGIDLMEDTFQIPQ